MVQILLKITRHTKTKFRSIYIPHLDDMWKSTCMYGKQRGFRICESAVVPVPYFWFIKRYKKVRSVILQICSNLTMTWMICIRISPAGITRVFTRGKNIGKHEPQYTYRDNNKSYYFEGFFLTIHHFLYMFSFFRYHLSAFSLCICRLTARNTSG